MKRLKILLLILIFTLFLGIFSVPVLYGAESSKCFSQNGGHCINFAATAAAPVPGLEFLGDAAGLGDLLSRLFTFGMGFVGIAAFIMFMIGGVQYLVAGDKDPTEAKNRMKNAAIGLGVALISWLILFTINPDLVKTLDLKIEPIKYQGIRLGENIKKIENPSDVQACKDEGGTPTPHGEGLTCLEKGAEQQKLGLGFCAITFDFLCESDAANCKKAGGKIITLSDGPYCSKPFNKEIK